MVKLFYGTDLFRPVLATMEILKHFFRAESDNARLLPACKSIFCPRWTDSIKSLQVKFSHLQFLAQFQVLIHSIDASKFKHLFRFSRYLFLFIFVFSVNYNQQMKVEETRIRTVDLLCQKRSPTFEQFISSFVTSNKCLNFSKRRLELAIKHISKPIDCWPHCQTTLDNVTNKIRRMRMLILFTQVTNKELNVKNLCR